MASISTSATVLVPRAREEVFAVATDSSNASRTLRSRGPFAGISKVEMHEGHTLSTGARRRIHMTDGTVLEEVILAYEPPVKHSYRWEGGAKFPFSLLVRSGTGTWNFSEVEGGTRIAWSYTFGLTSSLAYPLALPIVRFFRGWLQQGLEAIREEILSSAANEVQS